MGGARLLDHVVGPQQERLRDRQPERRRGLEVDEHGLLDDLVRLQQQRWGDRKTECFGGLEIDYQLKLRRLLHGDVGGLGAFENLVDEGRRPTIDVGVVHPIGHQSPGRTRKMHRPPAADASQQARR